MLSVTLHRAGRLDEELKRLAAIIKPTFSEKLSIFERDANVSVRDVCHKAQESLEKLSDIHGLRGQIRALVGIAQAQAGVTGLLAHKNGLDDVIRALSRVPGVTAPKEKQGDDDYYGRRRKAEAPAEITPCVVSAARIIGASERYKNMDVETPTEIEVSTLTPETHASVMTIVSDARARLDDISDRLRALNATTTVSLSDELLDALLKVGIRVS